jgi:hypothetical protein
MIQYNVQYDPCIGNFCRSSNGNSYGIQWKSYKNIVFSPIGNVLEYGPIIYQEVKQVEILENIIATWLSRASRYVSMQ